MLVVKLCQLSGCMQMQDQLQDAEILQRLTSMRRYAKDNSTEDVPFPDSPIDDPQELPSAYGYPLETWVKNTDEIVLR